MLVAALLTLMPAIWADQAIPVVRGPDNAIIATGVLLDADTFLTANHVAEGFGSTVTIMCGSAPIDGITMAVSPKLDLAIVALAEPCRQHPIGRLAKHNPRIGSRITLVGFPAGMFRMATQGIVSAYESIEYSADRKYSLITDATVFGGNSGGPVFDSQHRIVGIVSAGYCLGRGACYGVIVPISSIQAFLRGE